MGKGDRDKQEMIKCVLKNAWKEWVKEWVKDVGISSKYNKKTSFSRTLPRGESEIDHDAMEKERLMAQDDYIDLFESVEITMPTFFEQESSSKYICLCCLVLLVAYCLDVLQVVLLMRLMCGAYQQKIEGD